MPEVTVHLRVIGAGCDHCFSARNMFALNIVPAIGESIFILEDDVDEMEMTVRRVYHSLRENHITLSGSLELIHLPVAKGNEYADRIRGKLESSEWCIKLWK